MKKNEALMTRARRINPTPAEAFQNLAHSSEGQETLDAILQVTPPVRSDQTSPPRAIPRSLADNGAPRTTLRLRAIGKRTAAIAAAVAVVLGIITVGTSPRPGRSGDSAWAPELVRIAEESPRLLVGREGWRVTGANEFSEETGDMMFENGQSCLVEGAEKGCYWMSLTWYPAHMYADYFKDRKRGSDASWKIAIAGNEATIFLHKGTAPIGATFYALWFDGEHSMELRSDVIPTIAEFRAIAATLQVVDVDTWLTAMPSSVVTPVGRAEAIDEILADIPVPSNVDVEELKNMERVSNTYSLEGEVTNAVVCGWVQQWIDGTKAGGEAAVREAVSALVGSHRWAAMDENDQQLSFIADVTDAMATKSPINGDGSVPIGVGYQRHLGCPEG